MEISNDVELRVALLLISEEVIEKVSAKILKKLQANIKKYVYEYGGANKVYYDGSGKPTFQFFEAWDWQSIKHTLSSVARELMYDPSGMDYDPETWLHGSTFGGDARANLADILNKPFRGDGMRTSGLMMGNSYMSKKRKPYWDITIDELFDRDGIKKMIDIELRKFI